MAKKILIADAGGTSTQWCLIDAASGEILLSETTGGINAALTPDERIEQEVTKIADLAFMAEQLFFYGAGCNCMQNNLRITKAVAKYLNSCTAIEIASDLVAAGRALFGSGRGVVCILGTGSNCGLYEDGQIISNIPPLGYILGDEGSGSAIGKAILKAALRNELIDKSIITDICEIFECGSSGIVPRIYRGDAPNKALAQIAFVAYNHYADLQVQQIVDEEFNRFFNNCVAKYRDSGCEEIGFIGSLAEGFSKPLLTISKNFGYRKTSFIKSPMAGLICYHSKI